MIFNSFHTTAGGGGLQAEASASSFQPPPMGGGHVPLGGRGHGSWNIYIPQTELRFVGVLALQKEKPVKVELTSDSVAHLFFARNKMFL